MLVDIQLPSLKDAPDAWCCCELACWFSRKWVNCHPQEQALGKYCCVFATVSRDQIVTYHIGFVFDQRLPRVCVYILCLACFCRWLFAQCSTLALSRFHSNLGSVAVIHSDFNLCFAFLDCCVTVKLSNITAACRVLNVSTFLSPRQALGHIVLWS